MTRGNRKTGFSEALAAVAVMAWLASFSLGSGLIEASSAQKQPISGIASYYSTEACRYNKDADCPTADGSSLYELEADGALFAASYQWPLGTRLRVTNPDNGASVVVTVKDRGPNKRLGRLIDLGKLAFGLIAPLSQGVVNVEVTPI